MTSEVAAETAAVTPQGAQAAPEKGRRSKKATTRKNAPRSQTCANKAAPKSKFVKKGMTTTSKTTTGVPREFSKKNAILDLLRRKEGATIEEIAKATDWQSHSIRGFISGTISKKMKLSVESVRNERGQRVYKVK